MVNAVKHHYGFTPAKPLHDTRIAYLVLKQGAAHRDAYSIIRGLVGFCRAHLSIFQHPHPRGSTALNRAHTARATSNSHFGRRPRRFGIRAGTTTKLISSSNVQRSSVRPAACAGVRSIHLLADGFSPPPPRS